MTKLALALIACGTAFVPVLAPAPAQAQLPVAWVSGAGSNSNPCFRAAPCASFNAALAAVDINGQIHCADPGPAIISQLVITKSVAIDCHHVFGAISSCGFGVRIDIPVSASDPLRTVVLRHVNIDGGTSLSARCGTNGIQIVNAAVVSIESVVVQNYTQRGISDERTGGGRLTVANSTLRNNGGSGLIVLPASGQTRIDVAVDNVVAEGNGFGLVFANGAKATVSRSLIANNVSLGIDAENVSGGSGTEVAVDNSTISNNGTGLFTFGGAVLDVSNSNIAFNAVSARGPWFSFGNNRVHRNTNAGTLPMAMGAITHDVGQQ
jgi:Right handed beta helix region